MPIQPGTLAPNFTAMTHEGREIELSRLRGKKLWLAFYRFAACPLCNYRVHQTLERYREFEDAGIQILAVFQSTAERITQYVGGQKPPFPLIADPEMKLYNLYGVKSSWLSGFNPMVYVELFKAYRAGFKSGPIDGPATRVPADFLVDPEGLVWRSYYGRSIADHIPFESVSEFATDNCLDLPAGV